MERVEPDILTSHPDASVRHVRTRRGPVKSIWLTIGGVRL
ncbi:MAG: hypothetical protein RLZZ450_6155 [Pseudomonadota bacterium]|jgi:hypothetical protein